nr:hypothetical protein CFP56_02993 [Quercus suber]
MSKHVGARCTTRPQVTRDDRASPAHLNTWDDLESTQTDRLHMHVSAIAAKRPEHLAVTPKESDHVMPNHVISDLNSGPPVSRGPNDRSFFIRPFPSLPPGSTASFQVVPYASCRNGSKTPALCVCHASRSPFNPGERNSSCVQLRSLEDDDLSRVGLGRCRKIRKNRNPSKTRC